MRFHLGRLTTHVLGPAFPYGTLASNVIGGFLMGLLVAVLARHEVGNDAWRLALGVGLLGGFTTFSSFSLECVNMIERGQLAHAAGYVLASVIISVSAVFGGLFLVRAVA